MTCGSAGGVFARLRFFLFFFNDTATTEIYTLSYTTLFRSGGRELNDRSGRGAGSGGGLEQPVQRGRRAVRHGQHHPLDQDRKSTRLNSSHDQISYAVFCLKKKKHYYEQR